jgi:SAM-dependent methyltransferase
MPLDWIDTKHLSFNNLLLMEREQIRWFPGWLPESELSLALHANPVIAWYLRHKCPEVVTWLDRVMSLAVRAGDREAIYAAEQSVLSSIEDLLVYAIDPSIYDALPFLGWDDAELTGLVDFAGQLVLDVGSGTGRLALAAAERGAVVFPVEPVENLRRYLKDKSLRLGFTDVYPVDGLITAIPFPGGFADVTMGGHVFGDVPDAECNELERVTRRGGMVILCPGNNDQDNPAHEVLVTRGYRWSRFEEPGDGWKRKYWKTIE